MLLTLVKRRRDLLLPAARAGEELAIARQATDAFGESLKLFANRQLEGGRSRASTPRAPRPRWQNSAARIPYLEMQVSVKVNQISVLLGSRPGPVARGARLSDGAPADRAGRHPLGPPLLERRPDIRQAEYAARAANADIGVTIGGFLPKIGLSAILGGELCSSTRSPLRGAAPLVGRRQRFRPLFQGGSLHGQYDQAKAAWEEAKLRYQQTALSGSAT